MTRKTLSVLIAGLFVAAPAAAQDLGSQWASQGSITLGGIFSDIDAKDESRANQYRDISDGVPSAIEWRGRNFGAGQWIDLFGENFGRDDMYFNVRGGQYDAYKARLYLDWIPQNRLFEGRTPFSGSGSNELRAQFPRNDPNTWENVDIAYKRKDFGGYFEWQRNSPWYFRVDANQVNTEGTKLGASSNGASPGNGYVDLAFPVDYKTTNASFEGGYSTTRYQFSISYSLSEFENANETVTWNNPFWANGIDTSYLPPDNDYQRLALQGSIRQLPLNSTLAARATWDKLDSSVGLATQALTGNNIYSQTRPDVGTFDGNIENTTFTLALSSTPLKAVDTRVWYNYAKRDDQSTLVEFTGTGLTCGTVVVGGVGSPGPCDNEHYDYTKWNLGFDAYWKFMPGQKFGGGVEYQNIEQERPDYDEIENTKVFVEYKNTMVEGLSARIKYTYLDRDSNFLLSNIGVNANDPLYLERFIGRYDGQGVERHELKLVADWTPNPLVDVGLEFNWRENKWKRSGQTIDYVANAPDPQDEFLGRTNDKRYQVSGTLSYGDPSKFRTSLFGDYEKIRYDSYHRAISTVAGGPTPPSGFCTTAAPNCFNPGGLPQTVTSSTGSVSQNYNWAAQNEDENWMFGVGLDWPAMANLMVKASYLYVKTDGGADIQSQNNFGNPLPIYYYDDTKTQSFNLKAIYTINKNWQVTGGYAYEKYDYNDDQYNGYQYTVPPTTNAQSYANGWNAFTNYKANIFYLLGTYRF